MLRNKIPSVVIFLLFFLCIFYVVIGFLVYRSSRTPSKLLMYFSILSSGSNSESKSVLATEMGRSEGKSSSTGILAFFTEHKIKRCILSGCIFRCSIGKEDMLKKNIPIILSSINKFFQGTFQCLVKTLI